MSDFPADHLAERTTRFSPRPPTRHRPEQALHRGDLDVEGRHHHRARRPNARREHGEQLRVPRPQRLLRRPQLPPHHPRLHGPGRVPGRLGARWPRLPVRRRTAAGWSLRDRLARHGQRRAEHQRLAVLHHQRTGRRAVCRRCTRCSVRSCRASTSLAAIEAAGSRSGAPSEPSRSTPSALRKPTKSRLPRRRGRRSRHQRRLPTTRPWASASTAVASSTATSGTPFVAS